LSDSKCASKSGKLEKLSPEDVENNLDLIISSGHFSALIESNYFGLLVKSGVKKFQEMSQELKALTKEVADLKMKLEENKACTDDSGKLESTLSQLFKKEFDEFVTKLNAGA
jgi:hypothetical protein